MSLEKAKGVILGLAIGDAMGAPAEFMSLDQIKRVYGDRGIRDLPDLAVYTDDTQMSIAIAEALIEAGHKDIETLMERVKEEFIKWYHAPDTPSRAPGKTCLTGVANMEKGIHWTRSGLPESKGCGSAMRSAAVGYYYQHNPEKLKGVAHITGICTHRHPTADAACIGAAYLVRLALDGVEPSRMIGKLLNFTRGISDEWEEAIEEVRKCLDWEDEEQALSFLGEGWVGEEAVALALYCFLRYPDSYEKCVLRAANTNGDSDSIACIAGAISGAYLGVKAIPKDWIERIENKDYLIDLGMRLVKTREVL